MIQKQFVDKISDEAYKRILEISYIHDLVLEKKWIDWEWTLIRSSIMILYSHLEGYFKESCEWYLNEIKRTPIINLNSQIIIHAISTKGWFLWNWIKATINSIKCYLISRIINKNILFQEIKFKINTEDNLKYSLFKQILNSIWFKQDILFKTFKENIWITELGKSDLIEKWKIKSYYELQNEIIILREFDSIDNLLNATFKILLHFRNNITHWKLIKLNFEEYDFIYKVISCLLTSLKEIIINWFHNKNHLK